MRKYQQIIGGVVGGVLWLSLGGSAWAHTQSLPTSCSSSILPSAEDFFMGAETSIELDSGTSTWDRDGTITTKRGTGNAVKGGSEKYRYGRINLPSLAVGELRVFADATDRPTDALLCVGSSRKAYYKTDYDTINRNHDAGETAVRKAREAADTAAMEKRTEEALTLTTDLQRRQSETRVRSDLLTAADALKAISEALETAGQGERADTLTSTTADINDSAALAAQKAEARARAARVDAGDTTDDDPADELAALGETETDLDTAAGALQTHLDTEHINQHFKIRTDVNLGEREYILIVLQPDVTEDLTVNVEFHGALSASSRTGRIRDFGGSVEHAIHVTAPGLLTIGTTGSTDTEGTLVGVQDASTKGGGTGKNFKMAVPVATMGDYTLRVSEESGNASGGYTLDMAFAVAMPSGATADQVTATGDPGWGETPIQADDTTVQISRRPQDGNQADRDVFVFTPTQSGLLSINGDDGATGDSSNTAGTLFGPMGEIVTSTDSGSGNPHFGFSVPVKANNSYAVHVVGTDGTYRLSLDLDTVITAHINTTSEPTSIFTAQTLTAPTNNERDRNRYLFNIEKPGTLYLQTTGSAVDVQGRLYDPRGVVVASDNIGGTGNLRIVAHVIPGLYLLVVEGTSNAETGDYALSANFAEGVTDPDPTDTGDGGTSTTEVERLRTENARLLRELNACREPVVTDARGFLENPSGGFRSGIGLISGWVCAAEDVTVEILRGGVVRETLNVAYGTSRPDVPRNSGCRNEHAGFGMTYNFNHLPEGEHTIRAYADDELIGEEQTFEVVHLVEEFPDSNNFLELPDDVQARGECIVEDFPVTGEDTYLLWEESIQNFVIQDAG